MGIKESLINDLEKSIDIAKKRINSINNYINPDHDKLNFLEREIEAYKYVIELIRG